MKNGKGKGPMSLRKIDKILRKNGYHLDRYSGDHRIYKNEEGTMINIPPSCHKLLVRREFKEKNIVY